MSSSDSSDAHPAGDDTPTGQLPAQPDQPDQPGGPARIVPVTTRVTSAANTPTPSAAGHQPAPADPEEAAGRGALSIEDVVVEKVALAAAGEIDGVGGAARRVLGVATSDDDSEAAVARRPRVTARVSGQTVALEVRLTVPYPNSVRATTEAVRVHVEDRVQALTELRVSRVDIDVAALTTTRTPTRRTLS